MGRLRLPKTRKGRIGLAAAVLVLLAIGAASNDAAKTAVAASTPQTPVATAESSSSATAATSEDSNTPTAVRTTVTPPAGKTTVRATSAVTRAQPSATSSTASTINEVDPHTSSDARMEFYNHAETNAFGVSQADVDKLGNGICADLKDDWAPSNPGPGKAGLGYFNERDALAKLKFATADADVMIQDAVIGYCPDQAPMLAQAMARLTNAVQSTALGVMELPTATR